MLNGGRKSIEDLAATMTGPFAKGADGLNDKLAELEGKLLILGVGIGTALMPLLNGIANAVLAAANAFAAMPGPLQAIVGGVVALAAAFVVLAPAISAVISIAGVLAGLKIGATIAGWAALAGPAITAISAAFSGLLAFLTGTLLPGLLAFFSGPVGWTVLAVAAVVAMAIAFRKPLGDFLNWLWEWGKPIRQFWAGLWDGAVKLAGNAVQSIKSIFTSIGAVIKGAFNGILRNIFGSINGAINNINFLINRANALSAKVRGPQLPILPILNVPQFAQGGVVNGPTLAMVGEGGEREYIIPASKMAAASANYLSGARGNSVIPSGNAQINVTTGPVMQQGGQQYVSMADLERAMRKTADGVYASLRTPAGRYAAGVR
jgi:hypothetical protein